MAAGDHDEATLRRYSEAQARLEHAGGYTWRDRAAATLRGLGFAERDLDRQLTTFSGGELTRASLARALAGDPDLLLLDEPTNHLDVENLEWLEQELQSLDAAVILVAHDRWFLEAVTTGVLELEAGRSLFFPGPWHVWRLEKAARAAHAAKTAERVGADIVRLERFVERFRYKKSKAKQAQAKLTQIKRLETERSEARGELELLTRKSRSLGFDFLKPPRSGRTVVEADGLGVAAGRQAPADRRDVRGRARRARRSRRERTARARRRCSRPCSASASRSRARCGSGTASCRPTSRSTRSSSTSAAACSTAPSARPACRGRRPRTCSAASSSPAGRRTRSRSPRSPAASGGGSRWRWSSPPARTSSCSTSRRTTSTWRAARRSRPRSTPSRAPCCSSHTTALCSTRSRTGCWRSSTGRCTRTTAAGPSTPSTATSRRSPLPKPRPRKEKPKQERERAPRPSELEQLEGRISRQEEAVAELERRLADDWSDVDALAAHRQAREELQRLLTRWERLFEEAQA